MTKFHLIIIFTILYLAPIRAQSNYMETIIKDSCECLSKIPENEAISNMKMGLCLINSSSKFHEELLQDHNIDINKIDGEDGERLGELIALKMLTKCPEQINRIASTTQNETNTTNYESEDTLLTVEGTVNFINKGDFIVLSVLSDYNKTSKYYWLTFIESNHDLQNDLEKIHLKRVEIHYSTVELYDGNLGEYRDFNIIDKLTLID